jgi:hypothetical protein
VESTDQSIASKISPQIPEARKRSSEMPWYLPLVFGLAALALLLGAAVVFTDYVEPAVNALSNRLFEDALQSLVSRGWITVEGQADIYGVGDWLPGEVRSCTSQTTENFDFNKDKNTLFCPRGTSVNGQDNAAHAMVVKYYQLNSVADIGFEPDQTGNWGWHSTVVSAASIDWWCKRRQYLVECRPISGLVLSPAAPG